MIAYFTVFCFVVIVLGIIGVTLEIVALIIGILKEHWRRHDMRSH